jgi:hypothetical protein
MFSEGTAPLVMDSAEKSLKKINSLLNLGTGRGATEVDWDANGNALQVRQFDQNGNLLLTADITYDVNGNPTRIERH